MGIKEKKEAHVTAYNVSFARLQEVSFRGGYIYNVILDIRL